MLTHIEPSIYWRVTPASTPTRIAIMEFSLAVFRSLFEPKEISSKRGILGQDSRSHSILSTCHSTFIGDTDVTAPHRQFHGAADDCTPAGPVPCIFDRLRAAGRDAGADRHPVLITALIIRSAIKHQGFRRERGRLRDMQTQGRAAWHNHQYRMGSAVHNEDSCRQEGMLDTGLQRSGGRCGPDRGKGIDTVGIQARSIKTVTNSFISRRRPRRVAESSSRRVGLN